MNKFFLPFFLFFSLIFISTVFSKELPEDSSSGILKNVTADLTKDSDDIKLKYKAGKGLEFKGGDAFKLNLGARIQFRFDSADYNQAASGTQDSGTRVVSSLASISSSLFLIETILLHSKLQIFEKLFNKSFTSE